LLILVSIAPSINADRDKLSLETITVNDTVDYDGYTPIQLEFLLINRLRNDEGIEHIESEEDVLHIIESNAELNDLIVKLKSYDCGCEDKSSTEWGFPIICILLLIMMGLVFIPWMLLMIFFMIPPGAFHEMIELLFLFLSPFLLLYQRFNCPIPDGNDG